MDTEHAKGRAKDPQKLNFLDVLETQNGGQFGPISIKGQKTQYYVESTNLATFLLGQPKCAHFFWGQVFTAESPFRGQGVELRPTFLYAAEPDAPDEEEVAALPGCDFFKALMLALAVNLGHTKDPSKLATIQDPAGPQGPASRAWKVFSARVKQAKATTHPAAKGALGKHVFTTGSHVVLNHLLTCAFRYLCHLQEEDGALAAFLDGSNEKAHRWFATLHEADVGPHWFELPPEAFLAAAPHITLMGRGIPFGCRVGPPPTPSPTPHSFMFDKERVRRVGPKHHGNPQKC